MGDTIKKPSKGRLVVIDDDREMRNLIDEVFRNEGYDVVTFPLAIEALKAFQTGLPDVDAVISDLKMAQMDGMDFLKKMQSERPEIPVILITAFGSIDTAIEAMRNGAHHYLVKPFKLSEMSVTIERAVEKRRLTRENAVLRTELKKTWSFGDIIGKSAAMRSVFELVGRVAKSNASVLINGESGTGKEMVARAIHSASPRSQKPFVAINCTAIPETLLESELFGHAKGSFTGAIQRKKGLFEEANGGTVFLDEIGDMSPQLQAKLLRVLQERKIRPVGDTNIIDVDVRIIAATHKDLKAGIREGVFREDLFYRLSVIPIVIPPLRERAEDIPLLAEYFLIKYAAANQSSVRGFSKRAMDKLMKLHWPGNVRELENTVERAVVLAQGQIIDESDLPDADGQTPEQFYVGATKDFPTLSQLEERYMRLILDKTAGRKDKTAQILGISRRTLYRKEREFGLVPPDAPEEEVLETTPSEDEL